MKDTNPSPLKLYRGQVIERYGYQSLYTWMRTHLTEIIKTRPLKYVGLSLYREDGFNLTYEVFQSLNTNTDQNRFIKEASGRVEEAIVAIKDSIFHERSFLSITFDEEEHHYLIIRFDDKVYQHKTYGERVKQTVSIFKIDAEYKDLYFTHFALAGMVNASVSNPHLKAVIRDGVFSHETLKTLRNKLGSDSEVIESIDFSLKRLSELFVYITSLDKETLEALRNLVLIGLPKYLIMPDLRVKLFVKEATSLSRGNGNGFYFFLDTIRP